MFLNYTLLVSDCDLHTLVSKLEKSANSAPSNGSFAGLGAAKGSFSGAKGSGDFEAAATGGAGRAGGFPPAVFGGAGRGGGCFDFLGGKAGVGLSTRPGSGDFGALNGSLPKGSVFAFLSDIFVSMTKT